MISGNGVKKWEPAEEVASKEYGGAEESRPTFKNYLLYKPVKLAFAREF